MKQKKKRFVTALLLCSVILFAGCGKQNSIPQTGSTEPPEPAAAVETGAGNTETEPGNAEADTGNAEPGGLVLVTSAYGAFGPASGRDGFYELYPNANGSSNLLYTDFSSLSTVYVCGRPECLHNDESCSSWFPFGTGALFLNAEQTTLFCSGSAENGPETVWAMEPDGTNRRIFYQCAAREYLTDAAASDASSLFLTVSSVDLQTASFTKRVLRFDLQTGQYTEVHTHGGSDWLCGTFEDDLILLYLKDNMFRYTLFSPLTKEEREIFSGTSQGYAPARFHDGFLYVITPGEDWTAQISKLDISDQSVTVLCDGLPWYGSETAHVVGFYDGHMIVSVTDTREQDPSKIKFYQYGVDCETGEITELTLTTAGALPQFIPIIAECGEGFIVSTGTRSVPIFLKGTDGTLYESSFDIAEYAYLSREDYWANMPNYRPVTFNG